MIERYKLLYRVVTNDESKDYQVGETQPQDKPESHVCDEIFERYWLEFWGYPIRIQFNELDPMEKMGGFNNFAKYVKAKWDYRNGNLKRNES